jgi:folate-binding protein YgfZ
VAEHFGDPFREQRALAEGNAVVIFGIASQSPQPSQSSHGVIRLTGRDRLTWLDSLVSQEVSALRTGESAEALLLDPNGRVERVMHILDDGTATWILVERDTASLADWLDRMVFRRDVEVVDVTDEFTVVGVVGDGAAAHALSSIAASPNGVSLAWVDPWVDVVPGGWQYASSQHHPAADWHYREFVLERSHIAQVEQLVSSGTVIAAGTLALDALRIAAWRPTLADVDETSLPHEFDWLRSAVHLSKGCYRGQETVAKVHNLGHPPRRLVALDLDGTDAGLPEPGWPVALAEDPEKVVGHITSAARHFNEGPIALALIKRMVPVDAQLVVLAPGVAAHSQRAMAARQGVIVPPDAGKTVDVPRISRDRVRPTRS